jgi:hypothetical protein
MLMYAGAGIVNFGIQGSLFVFLLYALLAAETDPLTYTIQVLVRPSSAGPSASQQRSTACQNASATTNPPHHVSSLLEL